MAYPILFCLSCSASPFLCVSFCMSRFINPFFPVLPVPFVIAVLAVISWLSILTVCFGILVLADLLWQSCPACHLLPVQCYLFVMIVLFCLSHSVVTPCLSRFAGACPDLPVLFNQSYSGFPDLTVPFQLSCSGCHVVAGLFFLSFSGHPVLVILPTFSGHPIQSVWTWLAFLGRLSGQFFHGSPVLAIPSQLSSPVCPVMLFLLSLFRSACPVQLSHSGCHVRLFCTAVLSWLSCSVSPVLVVIFRHSVITTSLSIVILCTIIDVWKTLKIFNTAIKIAHDFSLALLF